MTASESGQPETTETVLRDLVELLGPEEAAKILETMQSNMTAYMMELENGMVTEGRYVIGLMPTDIPEQAKPLVKRYCELTVQEIKRQ